MLMYVSIDTTIARSRVFEQLNLCGFSEGHILLNIFHFWLCNQSFEWANANLRNLVLVLNGSGEYSYLQMWWLLTKSILAGTVPNTITNQLQELGILNFNPKACEDAYNKHDNLRSYVPFLKSDQGYLCAGSLTKSIDSCSVNTIYNLHLYHRGYIWIVISYVHSQGSSDRVKVQLARS